MASRVGTSQQGEAVILLSYIRRLAQQTGGYWLVLDSKAAVGALRTCQEGGHCGDGIHHLSATVLGPPPLPGLGHKCGHHAVAVDHRPNDRVDAARQEPPEVDLTWILRRPFSFLPPVPYRDQC